MTRKKINHLSIKRINFILFFLMSILMLIFVLFSELLKFKEYFILIILSLLIIFIIFNYLYIKDFEKSKKNIKSILNDNNLLNSRSFYTENIEQDNLFKYFAIDRNIKQKDYSDLEKVLQKFTPEYFLEHFSEKGRDRIELGLSTEKFMHVMFLDIIWFTTITERLKPERALLLLNIYFDWIVEIIKDFSWHVDKFLGDGILIVFTDKDSDNILKASIEIQKYIQNFRISEIWKNISIWIWINSWNVIMWTIWSTRRMELTIIWDVVNTASRIEWLTRKFKGKIIISEETFNSIKNTNNFNINYLWEKILKWKKIKKKIYWVESIINIELDKY